jgi:nucleotide-binding universal stress UspA family protein
MGSNEIVVGVDGSEVSLAAVRWAAREAGLRGAPLRIVLAYEWAWAGAQFTNTPPAAQAAHEHAASQLATAVAEARAAAPGIDISSQAVRGKPAQTLLDTSRLAGLLVVGNRGHGGFVNLLLGSISQQVAPHADTAVAVVRGRSDVTDGPVVVGVDGSESTGHTLDIAFQEAAARGATLVAIRAYELPMVWGGYGVAPQAYDPTEIEAQERQALQEAVAPWHDKYPGVNVETLVAKGTAAETLIGVSETAQLVVVGTRGHSGFTGLLLGSVGLQLLHHAHSAVLIARTPAKH